MLWNILLGLYFGGGLSLIIYHVLFRQEELAIEIAYIRRQTGSRFKTGLVLVLYVLVGLLAWLPACLINYLEDSGGPQLDDDRGDADCPHS